MATRGAAGDETARRRRCDREGDDGEGSSVNNAKFQSPVRKL